MQKIPINLRKYCKDFSQKHYKYFMCLACIYNNLFISAIVKSPQNREFPTSTSTLECARQPETSLTWPHPLPHRVLSFAVYIPSSVQGIIACSIYCKQ